MPLFEITDQKLSVLTQSNFALEKNLQILVEGNLETVFNCRLVQSEFPTGVQHSGKVDTLALSEDDNPVIFRKMYERWSHLYYCFRDDIIFDPQTGETCQPESLREFLRS